MWLSSTVTAIVVVVAATLGLRGWAGTIDTLSNARAARLPGLLRTTAPWPNNTLQLSARIAAMGLPPPGSIEHVHVFLVVFVHGRRVPVPSDVGLARDTESPLHTHAGEPGIVHVESLLPFWHPTLGEFFDVWGVRLSSTCLGAYCTRGAERLAVFVDGTYVNGDPRLIQLADHDAIAVVFGTADQAPREFPVVDWSRAL